MIKQFYTVVYDASMQVIVWAGNKLFELQAKELATKSANDINDFVKAMQRKAKIVGSRPL